MEELEQSSDHIEQTPEPDDCQQTEDGSDDTVDVIPQSIEDERVSSVNTINDVESVKISTDSSYMPAELNEEDEKQVGLGLPKVNCVEKIIICLDLNFEMEKDTFRSRAGDKFTQLQVVQKALRLYINSKSKINCEHEFALVVLDSTAEWVSDFTNNPREIIALLEDLRCSATRETETFDMSLLFDAIDEKVTIPTVEDPILPPPYIVRILFLYGRSNCLIESTNYESQKTLESSPYVFFDSLYIHEPLSEENKCEEIFNRLCKLDHRGFSYIFEVSKNPTKLYVYMAQLLAHPLQRDTQQSAAYKIRPLTPVDQNVPNFLT
ncbi:BRISC and BRCA1-A complex member 1 [Patella vulgata]|uniref:BRISC and BRCA1-A complex member 1 n=1 Tax=Patella vulgata TaxID=6465 RepID=UPI002180224A|nr:BRISC and BRCA1-A complex member 1 [Patella vulgata]